MEEEKNVVEIVQAGREPKMVEATSSETIQEVLDREGIIANSILADGVDADPIQTIGKTKSLTIVPRVKGG